MPTDAPPAARPAQSDIAAAADRAHERVDRARHYREPLDVIAKAASSGLSNPRWYYAGTAVGLAQMIAFIILFALSPVGKEPGFVWVASSVVILLAGATLTLPAENRARARSLRFANSGKVASLAARIEHDHAAELASRLIRLADAETLLNADWATNIDTIGKNGGPGTLIALLEALRINTTLSGEQHLIALRNGCVRIALAGGDTSSFITAIGRQPDITPAQIATITDEFPTAQHAA